MRGVVGWLSLLFYAVAVGLAAVLTAAVVLAYLKMWFG